MVTASQLSVARALKARAALAEAETLGSGTSGTALVPPVRCE